MVGHLILVAGHTHCGHRARLSLTPQSVPLSYEGTWRYALPSVDGADGLSQTLTIYALDGAGNRTPEAIRVDYQLDLVPPALNVSSHVSHPGQGEIALAGTVGDGGGVDEVYVWGIGPDGTSYREVVVREGAAWTYALGQTAAGTHTLWLEAYDRVGNLRTVGSFEVEVGGELFHVYLPLVLRGY